MTARQRAATWGRRLATLTWKELLQLSRDVPLLLFLLYSFSLSVVVSGAGITMQLTNAALLVHDADHSASSRELIHRFQPPYFAFAGEIRDPRQGLRQLDEGNAMLLLEIPPRFHEALMSGERTAVQLLVDTTNAPQGLSAAGYTVRIAGLFGAERGLASVGLIGAKAALPLVTSAHRVWFNPTQDERWFQSIAHVLRMITIFAVLLPAAALVREKERGTVEQLLVSPLSPFQIMFSKVLAMSGVILLATGLALYGVLHPVFHVPMKGSAGLFFLLTALHVFTTAGFGLVAATLAKNQAQVGMMTLFVVGPMLLLSGITSPYESMPRWVQAIMTFSPLRYYIDMTYGVMLKGAGLDLLWKSVGALLLLGGTLFGFGMWRFRRQFQ
ncbi:MAG: Inner membrane transport permease YhhJ [Nitrospirae bacterium]|nr:MAG: ABC transporter permease [Nitrospira sp. OLB3]MBV6468223.1 Inner membrane transport permease YhhJ [Nitrospirota bacterium]MCK6493758.1 ABC transporter permease [Nitrospira sp.]MEB2337453.1 ABC transporter permease [Nitrospirales bacterium]QOJ35399.1 MAG: ABC transporter permease [Nitrospira sp.]